MSRKLQTINEYIMVRDGNGFLYPKLDKMFHWIGDFSNIGGAVELLCQKFYMDKLSVERVYVIGFGRDGEIIGVYQVGQGDFECSSCSIRNIFSFLLSVGASSFTLAHNHTGNNSFPSFADERVTASIEKCGKELKIELITHLIISSSNHYMLGGYLGERRTIEVINSARYCLEHH